MTRANLSRLLVREDSQFEEFGLSAMRLIQVNLKSRGMSWDRRRSGCRSCYFKCQIEGCGLICLSATRVMNASRN